MIDQDYDDDDDNESRWRNWAGNISSVPSEILSPANEGEVRDLIVKALNQGGRVRAVGTGHSFSPLVVDNDQTLVEFSRFTGGGRKAWRWQKGGQDLVSYLPSATWADVRDALTTPDSPLPLMYLSTTGPLNTINATGFVAAGCHGTGWNEQTLSDLIWAIEFIDGQGRKQVFSEEATPSDMAAVRVNLGMLGIITQVTLRAEPMYRLHDEEIITETASVMGPNPSRTDGEIRTDNLHALITENDYVELFWFPGSGFDGQIWLKKFNRTTDDPRDVPLRPDGWIDKMAASVSSWSAANPVVWDLMLGLIWNTIHGRALAIQKLGGFVADAPRVLFYVDAAVPVLDLEVAIPIPSTGPGVWDVSNVVRAWYAAVDYVYANQSLHPLTVCLHARFTRSSQALLSPAYAARSEDRCCWIEVLSAYPKSETNGMRRSKLMDPHIQMLDAVAGRDWIGARRGRPHWAKNWQYIKPAVRMNELYPAANLEAFGALRRSMDPAEMFSSPFLRSQNLSR